MKIANRSFEDMAKFKHLGTLTDENCIHEEIKSRLHLGNAYYHSVQSLLSSCLLSRNVKVKIYKTIILPVILYGCETWSLTLREEHRLIRVFENRVLRKNTWTKVGLSNRRMEEVAQCGASQFITPPQIFFFSGFMALLVSPQLP
jgi:hypothetical protein